MEQNQTKPFSAGELYAETMKYRNAGEILGILSRRYRIDGENWGYLSNLNDENRVVSFQFMISGAFVGEPLSPDEIRNTDGLMSIAEKLHSLVPY